MGVPDGCEGLQLGKQVHLREENSERAWSAPQASGRNIPSGAGRRERIHECCWDLASQHLPSQVLEGF